MQNPITSLHHRIPWSLLVGTINQVLLGTVDTAAIRSLLRLSPGVNIPPLPPDTNFVAPLIKTFKASVSQAIAKKTLLQPQVDAINLVEQLIFTLPCNLFAGLNARSDDPANLPGTNMDFLPTDIDANGAVVTDPVNGPPLGKAQKVREKLFNRLVNVGQSFAVSDIEDCCTSLATLWGQISPPVPAAPNAIPPVLARTSLQQATGYTLNLWVQGVGVIPGYRLWGGANWTAADSNNLTTKVMHRVNKG
jgi:hypothetical protein